MTGYCYLSPASAGLLPATAAADLPRYTGEVSHSKRVRDASQYASNVELSITSFGGLGQVFQTLTTVIRENFLLRLEPMKREEQLGGYQE
jgi:hypothetical protein